MRRVNQVALCQVPVSRWGSQLWRPNGKRWETNHTSSPTCSIMREVWLEVLTPVCYAYTSSHKCQLRWRYALLRAGPKWQSVSTSFQQVFTCVHIAHILTPAKTKSKLWLVALQLLWQAGVGEGHSAVYLAMVVLIGLVNWIFHKRSDGLEQFLFCARRGMCLFHSLWKVTCVLHGYGSQTAFCPPALFVSVFLVWTHLHREGISFCLFVFVSLLFSPRHLKGFKHRFIAVKLSNPVPSLDSTICVLGCSKTSFSSNLHFISKPMKYKITRPTFHLSHFMVGYT